MKLTRVAAATSIVLSAITAHAQTVDPLSAIEHLFGASPVHMVAGHGGLTAGVAADGDIAVLSWPTPSCCDQLTFIASNDPNARAEPRLGVTDGFGITLGLVLTTPGGTQVSWLHDATQWSITPGYTDDTSLEPQVMFDHLTLGIHASVQDTVLPDTDVLQRRVTVTLDPTSTVTSVSLVTDANLGLTQNALSRIPLCDVFLDTINDFGALWDATIPGAIHFRPADRGPIASVATISSPPALSTDYFGPLDALMRTTGDVTTQTAALASSLDTTFVPGVYAIVATDPAATEFQIGAEGTAACDAMAHVIDNANALPSEGVTPPVPVAAIDALVCAPSVLPAAIAASRSWTRVISGAWADAQDGTLEGNPVAAWLSDSAQITPIAIDPTGHGDTRVLIAFGATAGAARTALATGFAIPPDSFAQLDHDQWTARAAPLALPDTLPTTISTSDQTTILRAARRALLHIFNGTDRTTGAIVASIGRQPPYGLDWPRDGSFFDYALDVANDSASVDRRLAWALPLARVAPVGITGIDLLTDPLPPIDPRNGVPEYPEAAWEMNYYPNGTMGGPIRFEIDNAALMIWSAAVHVGYVAASERVAVANTLWPQIQATANLLAAWRDPTNGLDALANEDDHTNFTSTLHGGTAVFAALQAAARVARLLGNTDIASSWEHRAAELRDALVLGFYDPTQMRFTNGPVDPMETNPGSTALGETAWLVWPSRLLPYDDPRIAAQVRYDLAQILSELRGDPGTSGGAYLTKTTLAAAMYLASNPDPSLEPMLEEAVTRLANDVMTSDTQIMGEVFVTLRNPDGSVQRLENRVTPPHLWEGALFYLTTMAMSDPSRFEQDIVNLPANMTPAPGTVPFVPAPDAGPMPARDASPGLDSSSDGGMRPAQGSGCGCLVPARDVRSGVAMTPVMFVCASWFARRRRKPR